MSELGAPLTSREAWLTAAAVFALALVVRVLAAGPVVFPIPEDTAYYVGVARNLVDGRGLVSDALWSYGTPPLVFPRPAFEIWLPLPTLAIAPLMAVAGTSFRVAQVMPIVVGAIVPVLAWRLAADIATEQRLPQGRARTLAVGTGVTAAVELPLVLHSTLPNSTMLFAALALGACILMARILRDPMGPERAVAGARRVDWRLVGLGALIGLAALTRNEAAWLALAWATLAWGAREPPAPSASSGTVSAALEPLPPRERVRLMVVPALAALAIFVPWAVRDWAVFGSPLPGQALTNALFVTGFDVFAYQDPPTLARYLAQGWPAIVQAHVDGIVHNLLSVLLVPSFPIGPIGFLSLPALARTRTARPLLLLGTMTFLVASLVFPVTTTWGTFLHAAGPVHVLLIIGCLAVLDALIVRIGVVRGWTRPVAWFGPALTTAAAVLFTMGVAQFGAQSRDVEERYVALARALPAAGVQVGGAGPVITDYPIWYATTQGAPALGLPDELPASVLALARRFGARYLVMSRDDHGRWPAVLASNAPGAACFRPVPLSTGPDPTAASALSGTRVWKVVCP